jgi:hypothetical protein
MCSRVRAKDLNANDLWLDGLASVYDISQNPDGPVTATFKFKDGEEHQASIVALNRVLYVKSQFGSIQIGSSTRPPSSLIRVIDQRLTREELEAVQFGFDDPGLFALGSVPQMLMAIADLSWQSAD